MRFGALVALVSATALGVREEHQHVDSLGQFEADLDSTFPLDGDSKTAGSQKYCIDTIPTSWSKEHVGQCKLRLFNLFGTLFSVTARTDEVDVPIDEMFRNAGKSSLVELSDEIATTNSATVIVSATSSRPVSDGLRDKANEVIFIFPLYKEEDTAFSILHSPMQLWRLVKWAVAGYKVVFRRVNSRDAAIAAIDALATVGKVRHVVIGGHGNSKYRTISISDNQYFSTSQRLLKETTESRTEENRVIFKETRAFFQRATLVLGDKYSAPETSIFIESCGTAKEVQLRSTGEVVSMFDDIVGFITEVAQRGQKIKIVGSRESFNSNQLSMALKSVKGRGHLWEASVNLDWQWLLFSGSKEVTATRWVEP